MAVSRRNLEKRFRNTIGRTILEEIQLVRLERAKRLLIETTYPVSKVADTGWLRLGRILYPVFPEARGQNAAQVPDRFGHLSVTQVLNRFGIGVFRLASISRGGAYRNASDADVSQNRWFADVSLRDKTAPRLVSRKGTTETAP